jgi:hypothetical protein
MNNNFLPYELYRPLTSDIIPEIVLELLDSHFGVTRSFYPNLPLHYKDWSSQDWKNVANVINKYEKWDCKSLLEAFTHSHNIKHTLNYFGYEAAKDNKHQPNLLIFKNNNGKGLANSESEKSLGNFKNFGCTEGIHFSNTSLLGPSFRFGEKTCKNPTSIDIIDMYNICVILKIPLTKDISDYDMSYLIRKHFENDVLWRMKDTDIDKNLLFNSLLSNVNLKDFCNLLEPSPLKLPDHFLHYTNPKNDSEAVQTYFLDHKIYIGHSKSPLLEYYARERNLKSSFICDWMQEISKNHKHRICYNKYFNINIGFVHYHPTHLYQLYCYEGNLFGTSSHFF